MDFSGAWANPVAQSDLARRKPGMFSAPTAPEMPYSNPAPEYGSQLAGFASEPVAPTQQGGGNWDGPLQAVINNGDVPAALAKHHQQQTRGGGGLLGRFSL